MMRSQEVSGLGLLCSLDLADRGTRRPAPTSAESTLCLRQPSDNFAIHQFITCESWKLVSLLLQGSPKRPNSV